nr:MAG TPA: hypothetical protein [Caudoviricetes sp.]
MPLRGHRSHSDGLSPPSRYPSRGGPFLGPQIGSCVIVPTVGR